MDGKRAGGGRAAARIAVRPLLTASSDTSLGGLVAEQSRRRGFGRFLGSVVDLPVVGHHLARILRAPIRLRPISTRVTRLHAWMLRRSGGRLRRSWLFAAGQPVLALTTTGRKSRLQRTTAVACFADGEDLVVAGMNLGIERQPAWALNLEANPAATIEIAGETVAVQARRATGEQAERLWRRWLDLQPSAGAYRELAGRDIPLFVLTRRPA
jgi:deazaflavin-dependent oxidoreductase (nitroreductase family)